MRLLFIALFAALFAVTLAERAVLFERTIVPKDWSQVRRASPLAPIKFMVALKHDGAALAELDAIFQQVSDPKSMQYQEYMSIEDILSIVTPAESNRRAVLSWLHGAGIRQIRDMGDAFEVSTNVLFAEQLLQTEFHLFVNNNSNKSIIKAFGKYSVPTEVAQYVHMLAGVSDFPIPRYTVKRYPANPIDGSPVVIPQTVQTMYGSPSTPPQIFNSSVGVIEFEEQYYSPDDLQTFGSQVGISIAAVTAAHTVGYNDPTNPGIEAELDIQYIAAVGQGVTDWFWIEGGETWLYGFATHMFATADVPLVNSISYGWNELDQCESGIGQQECQQLGVNSTGYVERVNVEFQKIGLRGITLICASGDSGANGRTDEECVEKHFNPDFPGSSPFITAVGATQVVDPVFALADEPPACKNQGWACISGGNQTAVSYAQAQFASGGGFSYIGQQQSYQTQAVADYFSSGVTLPPSTYYVATGRGYPDVAAFGSNVLIYSGGLEPVGGTSCSSPIFAGIVSFLNNVAIQKNGKPLGFLNPLLYQMWADLPSAFTDITVGDNHCTESGCALSCKGYYAYKGWDPVTGLGTPVFSEMLSYVESNYAANQKISTN